jgi:PadR family transcriptional regulator PadR
MSKRDNFRKGTIEMMVLYLLAESDLYGYQISQAISERSGGVINVREGSLYPVLYKLLDDGYISDSQIRVGRRRIRVYYHIESSGLALLQELVSEYRIFEAGLSKFLTSSSVPVGEEQRNE